MVATFIDFDKDVITMNWSRSALYHRYLTQYEIEMEYFGGQRNHPKVAQLESTIINSFGMEPDFYLHLYFTRPNSDRLEPFFSRLPQHLREDKALLRQLFQLDRLGEEQDRVEHCPAAFLIQYFDPQIFQDPEWMQELYDLDLQGFLGAYPPDDWFEPTVAYAPSNLAKSFQKYLSYYPDGLPDYSMLQIQTVEDVLLMRQVIAYCQEEDPLKNARLIEILKNAIQVAIFDYDLPIKKKYHVKRRKKL